jgi:hypothetical protein
MVHPSSVPAPQEPAPERARRAQSVLASSLDPALPAVPLDTWIRQVVGSSASYQWADGACAGPRRSIDAPVGICGIVWAVTADAAVTVSVHVGERHPEADTDTWTPARLDDVFIERGRSLLTLERLGDLPRFLGAPTVQWPKREVTVEKDGIRCSPNTPKPLDEVICSVAVSNPGETTVHARVYLEVQPYPEEGTEVVVKLPAHARKSLKFSFPWPDEAGAKIGIGVELIDRSPYQRYDERGEPVLRPRSTVQELHGLIEQSSNGELEPILMASGTLATSRSFDLPVDSTISRLLVEVELDRGLSATLFRPGGVPVTDLDRDVTLGGRLHFEVGRAAVANRKAYTISAPDPGVWRLELTPTGKSRSGSFEVTARGTSPVSFEDFEFVRLEGIVHRGYFAVDEEMPLAGGATMGRARVPQGLANPAFRLIDQSGATLQALALRSDDPGSLPDSPVGPITVPTVPFSIVMDATDTSGAPIQRQFPVLFRPQTVSVSFGFDRGQIPSVVAAAVKRFRFTVTNHGPSTAAFVLNAAAHGAEIRELSPTSISLQPGASVVPSFELVVPAKASRFDSIDVRLSATSAADTTLTNSTRFRLEVAPPDDQDDDSVKNELDNCPEFPNGDQLDSDRDGLGDFCDDTPWSPVTIVGIKPGKGPAGTTVTISGTAFDTTPAKNTVTFGHVPAVVRSATATELVVIVPAEATSGLIIIRTARGDAMSPVPFVIDRR